jgi:uncharacterized protein
MKIIINNIKLPLEENIDALKINSAQKLNVNISDIKDFRIVKESIDSRKKNNIHLVYSVMVKLDNNNKIRKDADIKIADENTGEKLIPGNRKLIERPVIIGSGPAGLFAALILSENGYKPIVIERGDDVEKRSEIVSRYWKTGVLDPESNVQFGEGGAGTFSDGKLTTRINDPRCDAVMDEFNNSGIPEDVLYKAHPHIGTDKLKQVLINIRSKIIKNGGDIRFRTKAISLKIQSGKITGVVTGNGIINSNAVILAIGHSSRDTFESLNSSGIIMIPKPFSAGVRIEHHQKMIDIAQFGSKAGHPKLQAAEYHLFHKTGNRTVYSFCMCPGGTVVAAASEQGMIATNGMSSFARSMENGNSAWVVSITPDDYGSEHPLSGIEFQRNIERQAFKLGGGNNSAPVQRLKDFLDCQNTGKLGRIKPSYTGTTKTTDLNGCLPDFIRNPLKDSIRYFNSRLSGFGIQDAVLTGVETRTSSPVRIKRDESFQSEGLEGLYPAGEGAGYAGGIVSAAVDGIRIAEQIVKTFKPL